MIPESQYTANEKLIAKTLEEINSQVNSLIRNLTITGAGNIKTTAGNLKRVKSMQKEIMASLTTGEFKTAMEKVVSGYAKIPDYVSEAFSVVDVATEFSAADADMIRIMQNDTLNEASALAAQWGGEINSAIYTGTIAGTPRKDLIKQTQQLLIGHTDARGRPMQGYASTIVNTRIAELDTLMMMRKGDEIGVERWRYTGSTIADSRPWCVSHAGRIFTTEEVKAWAGKSWAGKKSGDPFIVRGGWNCRHGWSPVIDA